MPCSHDSLHLSAPLIPYESDRVFHLNFIKQPAGAVDIVETVLRVKFKDEALGARL
jgi:hypothetical protein